MGKLELKVKRIRSNAVLPEYRHDGDVGLDLYSTEYYLLRSGERGIVPTGLKVEIPYGYELQIRPRSGLAVKSGVTVLNTPGTIDFGYRGEIKVILINHGEENFEINQGDRIAQMVLNKVGLAEIIEVEELSESERGEHGFGSTGI